MSNVAGNQITSIENLELVSESGPVVAVTIALDCNDLSGAEPFVAEVVDAVLEHPFAPDTSALLITLTGTLKPDEFALFWNLHVEENENLFQFMLKMRTAEVAWMEFDDHASVSLLPVQCDPWAKRH